MRAAGSKSLDKELWGRDKRFGPLESVQRLKSEAVASAKFRKRMSFVLEVVSLEESSTGSEFWGCQGWTLNLQWKGHLELTPCELSQFSRPAALVLQGTNTVE